MPRTAARGHGTRWAQAQAAQEPGVGGVGRDQPGGGLSEHEDAGGRDDDGEELECSHIGRDRALVQLFVGRGSRQRSPGLGEGPLQRSGEGWEISLRVAKDDIGAREGGDCPVTVDERG